MNSREANVMLTKAALLDPRMKRLDLVDQADMADAWAEVLIDVSLEAGVAAVYQYYRGSSAPIMPSHVLEIVGIPDVPATMPDVTDEILAESKARALAAAGVTEAEYEAHARDVAWVRAHFVQGEVGS